MPERNQVCILMNCCIIAVIVNVFPARNILHITQGTLLSSWQAIELCDFYFLQYQNLYTPSYNLTDS